MLSGGPLAVAAQSSRTHRSVASGPKACGVERWRVKILADESRERISWSPETTSIASLHQIPAPRGQLPTARRIAPHELTLYRVHAIVRQILSESDGDWHVVLADPDRGETLVAEIPDSACALGSGHEADYAATRRVLRSIPRGALVELDGIGFFDYLHGQRGMAPNGFELHPVVAIRPLDIESEQGIQPSQRTTDDTLPRGQRADSAIQVSGGDVQVWLNTNSLVYHCANTRWYGKTKDGEFMRESEAVARGARPAYGRRCSQ